MCNPHTHTPQVPASGPLAGCNNTREAHGPPRQSHVPCRRTWPVWSRSPKPKPRQTRKHEVSSRVSTWRSRYTCTPTKRDHPRARLASPQRLRSGSQMRDCPLRDLLVYPWYQDEADRGGYTLRVEFQVAPGWQPRCALLLMHAACGEMQLRRTRWHAARRIGSR